MFWDNFKEFMRKPYNRDDMDAGDWFWFVGLLIVILIAWQLIYKHVQEVV